jgi:hypothetical protein
MAQFADRHYGCLAGLVVGFEVWLGQVVCADAAIVRELAVAFPFSLF